MEPACTRHSVMRSVSSWLARFSRAITRRARRCAARDVQFLRHLGRHRHLHVAEVGGGAGLATSSARRRRGAACCRRHRQLALKPARNRLLLPPALRLRLRRPRHRRQGQPVLHLRQCARPRKAAWAEARSVLAASACLDQRGERCIAEALPPAGERRRVTLRRGRRVPCRRNVHARRGIGRQPGAAGRRKGAGQRGRRRVVVPGSGAMRRVCRRRVARACAPSSCVKPLDCAASFIPWTARKDPVPGREDAWLDSRPAMGSCVAGRGGADRLVAAGRPGPQAFGSRPRLRPAGVSGLLPLRPRCAAASR